MSKFLLNLLVQISKALVYSKNQILFGKEFSSLSAQPAQQLAGPSGLSAQPQPFFSFPTGHFPPPTGPQPLGRPSSPHGPTAVFFLHTAPAERCLPACTAAAPEAPRPPLLQRKTPPSTIKPQPLLSLNRSFTAPKSPCTLPPVSPPMPAIIAA
jgi:hypothetical protein